MVWNQYRFVSNGKVVKRWTNYIVLVFLLQLCCSVGVYGSFVSGDVNGDCLVGIEDLAITASQWLGNTSNSEAGLVAYWNFDETSNTFAFDISGSGYYGYVINAEWNPTGGFFGGALEFAGQDFVWITQGYKGYHRVQSKILCHVD